MKLLSWWDDGNDGIENQKAVQLVLAVFIKEIEEIEKLKKT